ncbi:hypothetical protein [Sulfuriferula sp.]|uniref:hypothetical protein n=1 Tax=Sulfuriferula sp. TaxID=2025307 RepID=UPI002730E8CB|nr:hypothetical protein [Sulfuriferula sp.]MDP2025870.1 hypothetical protein [Sulfuriferula sp.]
MNYDPNWTLEAAIDAEAGAPGDPNDPTRPLARWLAHAQLNSLEWSLVSGKKSSLALAIRVCIQHGLPLPAWAGQAFSAAHDQMLMARLTSWDEVFGAPLAKGKHGNAWRKKNNLRKAVRAAVDVIRRNEPGTAIDGNLFDRIGQALRPTVSKTTVSNAYYDRVIYVPLYLEQVRFPDSEEYD